MSEEILTLPEVASLLKVAEKTVYTMAQRGEIPAFKVRGQWRFKRFDLDQWIECQKSNYKEQKQVPSLAVPRAGDNRGRRRDDN